MSDLEQWQCVVGYERSYEVSDLGRVRSRDREVSNGGGRRLVRGRVLRPWTRPDGHLSVTLSQDNVQRTLLVHRIVLEAFYGPCPDGLEGCHGDGVATNNRVSNLRWDTHASNVIDTVRHGTHSGVVKTHCKREHPLAAPNLKPAQAAKGHRSCLSCAREYALARAQRRPFDVAKADERFRLLKAA